MLIPFGTTDGGIKYRKSKGQGSLLKYETEM